MKRPIDNTALASVLEQMGISDISCATIRQSGEIARTLEKLTGIDFLHLEMGIPGLPPAEVGVEAECAALRAGQEVFRFFVYEIRQFFSGLPKQV